MNGDHVGKIGHFEEILKTRFLTTFDHFKKSIFGSFEKRAPLKRRYYSWERVKKADFSVKPWHGWKWPDFVQTVGVSKKEVPKNAETNPEKASKKVVFLSRALHKPKCPLFEPNIVLKRSENEAKLKMAKSVVSTFRYYSCKSQKVAFFWKMSCTLLDQANIQILFLESLQKKVVFERYPLSVILVCTPVISLK